VIQNSGCGKLLDRMSLNSPQDISGLLTARSNGAETALDDVIPAVFSGTKSGFRSRRLTWPGALVQAAELFRSVAKWNQGCIP